jgi:hypothetical protein
LLSISLIAYAVSTCFNLLVRLGRIPDELLRTMRAHRRSSQATSYLC